MNFDTIATLLRNVYQHLHSDKDASPREKLNMHLHGFNKYPFELQPQTAFIYRQDLNHVVEQTGNYMQLQEMRLHFRLSA